MSSRPSPSRSATADTKSIRPRSSCVATREKLADPSQTAPLKSAIPATHARMAGESGTHRPLSSRLSDSRADRPLMLAGSGPFSMVLPRYRSTRLERFPNSGGTGPLNVLPPNVRPRRYCRLPKSAGMEPVSALRSSASHSRFSSCPSAAGIESVNQFSWRNSDSRLPRLPSSTGMGPVNPLFPPTSSHNRWDSAPSSGGSEPTNPLPTYSRAVSSQPPRRSPVTRPSATSTPYQSSSGALLSQLVLSVQSSPPVAR